MAATTKRETHGAHVQVDIVEDPGGTHFEPSELTVAAGTILVWTNRTVDVQFLRIGRRELTLAAAGQDGAVALTAPGDGDVMTTASLRSNPSAKMTLTVSRVTT